MIVMTSKLAAINKLCCCRRQRYSRSLQGVILGALALFLAGNVSAQSWEDKFSAIPTAEFHFARLVYQNAPGSRRSLRGWGDAWTTDYADAEYHLTQGIKRLTLVDSEDVDFSGNGARLIKLDNDSIYEYPWLYAVEVGQWLLSNAEAKLLREYLDRGGFLMVDDFWGYDEWQTFTASMQRVFPDREIIDIPDHHPIMRSHFDIKERTQIPGRRGPRPGLYPKWRAIFDDDGRVMVAINFNMDMGDAWEHADDPAYPAKMTGLAYRFAMNYIVYSMTH